MIPQLKIQEIFLDWKKKKKKVIKDRMLRDIRNLIEHDKEEENYSKPIR